MCKIPFLLPNLVAFLCYTVIIHLEKLLMRCDTMRTIWWDLCRYIFCVYVSSIGRPFRSPLWWWWKNGGPSASGRHLGWPHFRFRKWGHPRWRPEAEGSPFSTTTTIGIEKAAPSLGWRHFRRRHLESKMAAPHVTSGGRRDVIQTSAPSMSPVEVWLYLDLKSIRSLASPRHYPSDWVSCPLATTRKWSVCTCRKLWKTFDFSKLLLYFFFFFFFLNCTLQ